MLTTLSGLAFIRICVSNSVRISQRARSVFMTKIDWLLLYREVISIYGENYTKEIYCLS